MSVEPEPKKGRNVWQKGVSANPGGRPRGQMLSTKLKHLLEAKQIDGLTIPKGLTLGDMIVRVMVRHALTKGDIRFIKEIFDRTEGKPVQHVGFSGEASRGIELVLRGENGETLGFGPEGDTPLGMGGIGDPYGADHPAPRRILPANGQPGGEAEDADVTADAAEFVGEWEHELQRTDDGEPQSFLHSQRIWSDDEEHDYDEDD